MPLLVLASCSDGEATTERSTTTAAPATTTAADPSANDPELEGYLLEVAALPKGFAVSDQVDDTITAFCAGEDATAGLSASARAAVAFTRAPPGASVIQLVFRFDGDGAAAFVDAADSILDRCSEVPDLTGLAFAYQPLGDEVAASLDGADEAAGRFGTSVGSERLTIAVAAFRHGDVGQLVAVLGLDLPRAELDELALAAFGGAMSRAS